MTAPFLHSGAASISRTVDAWYDAADSGRAMWIVLALFVACWTSFDIIANASVGVHGDVAEAYAWGQHPQAGYFKHPPLSGLLAGAWSTVFPAADWAFYLLATINAAVGLYFIDRIARLYLQGDKRAMALLLVLLTPFFQFIGSIFNANQVLLSTWPMATFCFLQAFATRTVTWSALAGAAAATALLGKYFSIFLIAGFAIAALAHPARAQYFRSPSPWISSLCALVLLAPHIHWLMSNGYQTFEYARGVHQAGSPYALLRSIAEYLSGGMAYVVLPVTIFLLAARPSRNALRDIVAPRDPDMRMLLTMLAAFLLLPPVGAMLSGVKVSSIWTMQSWFLLPIVLLAPASIAIARPKARAVAWLVMALMLGPLMASPAVAWYRHRHEPLADRAYYRPLAEQVTQAWRQISAAPLRIVMGSPDFDSAVAFYSPDHPTPVAGFRLRNAPWISAQDLDRQGFAVVCAAADRYCLDHLNEQRARNPEARSVDVGVANRHLGHTSASRTFLLLLMPPRISGEATSPIVRPMAFGNAGPL